MSAEHETKPFPWFGFPRPKRRSSAASDLIGTAVGIAIGALVWQFLSHWIGGLIITVALVLGAIAVFLPSIHRHIKHFLERFASLVGRVVGIVLLTPLFLIGFTLARLVSWLTGRDPLRLKTSDEPSFWVACDADHRKRKYIRAMFVTEPHAKSTTGAVVGWLAIAIVALALGELALRGFGFGRPVLYINDPVVGYMPLPSQTTKRYGATVAINQWGMRAPDVPAKKGDHVFRILMLGDSTLYGGSYVENEELYARILQRELDGLTDRSVEVLNMGVNGWGPFHKMGYVEKFGAFEADLAIICLPIGDIFRSHFGVKSGGAFYLASDPPSCALAEIFNHVRARLRVFFIGYPGSKSGSAREKQGEIGIQQYRKLAETLSERGCRVIVEVLPSRVEGTAEAGSEQPAEVKALRDAVVDVAEFAYPKGLFADAAASAYHDSAHLDVLGHVIYAEYLTQRIAELVPELFGDAWAAKKEQLVGTPQE